MIDRYRKIIAACGIVSLLSLGTAAVATAQTYTVTDLGTLGGSGIDVNGINNAGQVVGGSEIAGGGFHAFVWQNGTMTDLGTLGGLLSEAYGINGAGQVVGESETAAGETHAALWQKDSQGVYSITDLGTLGGTFSSAHAINNAGVVVGQLETANGERHAALWQKDSNGVYTITDLGTRPSIFGGPGSSGANGINNAGQVVGGAGGHAFLWQHGVMTDLGTLPGDNLSTAVAINDAGQVVGLSDCSGCFIPTRLPFLWQNGGMISLGFLGLFEDDRHLLDPGVTAATGINAAGQVVGTGQAHPFGDPSGSEIHAFLWQNGVIADLNTLIPADSGWVLGGNFSPGVFSDTHINDLGQITGTGFFQGTLRGFILNANALLDPVPELLDGPAVVTTVKDKERLASKGRTVLGVAADGVTQLVIRIPAKSVGDQITLTVLNAQQAQSFAKDEDGAVSDVINPPSFGSSVTVTAVDTAKGPMAFALYLAPKDFVRNCGSGLCQSYVDASSREINVQINGSSTFPIKIVRSPVLLIHGLWGQQSGWDGFKLVTDPRFKVFRADYKETNGESFEVNTSNVEAELDLDLREFKSVSKVAAVQFDLVTHSMGGLLARKLATLPLYERSTNYRQGDIHKLITLDTPHLGSQFANRLEASSPLCKFIFNRIGKKIGGAVRDLQYGSPAIAQLLELRTPIKARLIAGQATKLQEDMSAAIFVGVPPLNAVNAVCGPLLTLPGGFPEVFQTQDDPDGHSDLIVSVVSQVGKTIAVGRQDPPADSPYIGIEHTKVPVLFPGPSPLDDADIGQRVIDLLNTPVSIIDFGDILP